MNYTNCINCFAQLNGSAVCPRCGFDHGAYVPQPHHLRPGTVLCGRYVIGRAMGQGGFGITYAGFDPNMNRRVAIKEFYPNGVASRDASRTDVVTCTGTGDIAENFRLGVDKCVQEARSLAQLDDIPGVVRGLDQFQANNTAYIIMEFVEGVTLREYLRQRLPQKPDFREAVELLAPIGKVLQRVHERGYVHRDVSPDNIMINTEGEPKLLDFGAVKMVVSDDGGQTEHPIVKRGFSPIEMYSTEGKIGPWSDVYSYCATLYYMVTGSKADEPTNRINNDTLGGKLANAVTPEQMRVLEKGMALQQQNRYQNMSELLEACKEASNVTTRLPLLTSCINCFEKIKSSAVCPHCGFDQSKYVPKDHHLPPRTVLQSRYIVGRVMGQAGIWITYAGFDTVLNRKVSVKEYFPYGIASRDARQPLKVSCNAAEQAQRRYDEGKRNCINEARALEKLNDIPGLVQTLSFQENNTAYIIMELVEGVTLRDHLSRLPQKPNFRQAVKLLAPIGNALQKMHERGYVHRDVSPDNIIISPKGELKLLGFRAVDSTLTPYGNATVNIVKCGFSPFEMYSNVGKIGPWSDVYSYCATLYYMITGSKADEPTERVANDTIGARLETIVSSAQKDVLEKGLALKPQCRYQKMSELLDALQAARTTQFHLLVKFQNLIQVKRKKRIKAFVKGRVLNTGGEKKYGSTSLKKLLPVFIAAAAVLCILLGVVISKLLSQTSDIPSTTENIKSHNSVNVGDYVEFGAYEQDNDTSNGKETIEWLVLAKEDGKALLISRCGLDCQQYNTEDAVVTWKTCTLRTWLNGTFMNSAFTIADQGLIATTTVSADANPIYNTYSGNDTNDKIFLLSINETNKYFNSNDERKCQPTAYAKEHVAWTNDAGCCWWWLRSCGSSSLSAALVFSSGDVGSGGTSVSCTYVAVRPALWINIADASIEPIPETAPPTTEPPSETNVTSTTEFPSDTTTLSTTESPSTDSYKDIDTASVGDFVVFGAYEQDNNTENGAEPIVWRVLGESSGFKILISEKILECMPYNETDTAVTWETCTLRKWLNTTFFDKAFSEKEKIKMGYKNNSDGNNEKEFFEYVSGLTNAECEMYLPKASDRQAVFTEYARAQLESGVHQVYLNGWWLRQNSAPIDDSVGDEENITNVVCPVDGSGNMSNIICCVTIDHFGVRPVIYVGE